MSVFQPQLAIRAIAEHLFFSSDSTLIYDLNPQASSTYRPQKLACQVGLSRSNTQRQKHAWPTATLRGQIHVSWKWFRQNRGLDDYTSLPTMRKLLSRGVVMFIIITFYFIIIIDPGTQFRGNEKITLCNTENVQKSSCNEPYSSSSFTKQSCSKMAL